LKFYEEIKEKKDLIFEDEGPALGDFYENLGSNHI